MPSLFEPAAKPCGHGSLSWARGGGGFYSYDFLENAIGCDIHSATRAIQEFQDIAVGDEVRLAPQLSLNIATLNPGRSLVLRGGIPIGNSAPPYDFTWAFTLRDEPYGATRLLVRERYSYTRPWARLLIEPTEAISFVMSQKMLCAIRDRVERSASYQSQFPNESSRPVSVVPAS